MTFDWQSSRYKVAEEGRWVCTLCLQLFIFPSTEQSFLHFPWHVFTCQIIRTCDKCCLFSFTSCTCSCILDLNASWNEMDCEVSSLYKVAICTTLTSYGHWEQQKEKHQVLFNLFLILCFLNYIHPNYGLNSPFKLFSFLNWFVWIYSNKKPCNTYQSYFYILSVFSLNSSASVKQICDNNGEVIMPTCEQLSDPSIWQKAVRLQFGQKTATKLH